MRMIHDLKWSKTGMICMTLTASLFLFCGCSKTESTSAGPGSSSAVASSQTVGQTAFTANCAGCHSINGVGGTRGPDLSHTGAEAEHTQQWLADFIKNPKSKDPHSRMPAMGSKVSDGDIQAVSAYLAGLK